MKRHYATVVGALMLCGLVLPPLSSGVGDINEVHSQLPAIDTRTATVEPTAAQVEQAASLGAVRWNQFGTPQSLIRHGGFVSTGVAGETAAAAARGWLEQHRALFRLSSTSDLRLATEVPLGDSGAHTVVFQQYVDGLPSPDGYLSVGLTRQGGTWSIGYVSSTITGDEAVATTGDLTAEEAWVTAADAVGTDVSIVDIQSSEPSGEWTRFEVDSLEGTQEAREVAFATPTRGARTAYETVVSDRQDGEVTGYRQVIDAATEEILFRQSTVDHAADNPKWKVFPGTPRGGSREEFPWNYPSTDIRRLWCWFPASGCQYLPSTSLGDNNTEWDKDARTNTPTFTTIGNAANSSEAWFNAGGPGPTGFRPTSATRDYVYPWTNVWYETRCDPANFETPGESNDIEAATTNLFTMHSRMHDWAYVLGFTEDTWNGQSFNFGRNTPGENDPVLGQAQAGGANGGFPNYAGRDNANMNTQRDGTSSRTNMYLWQPIAGTFYAPCVDGDFDMSVIAHEFGHMIENRMIGKSFRRQGNHAGMMGESNADLHAMEYLNEYGFVPSGHGDDDDDGGGESSTVVGRYVTGNAERAIRNYDMAFDTAGRFPRPGRYDRINPLNLSDLGYDITGPQVHADGEIWSATNFDIRELLLNRYRSHGQNVQRECADGTRPVQSCPGNRRWVQLMFDAYILMPVAPSFLDARDAYLAADMLRFGGANQDLLWLGFARRGFGENAQTTGPNDNDPVANFESPRQGEETITFRAFAMNEGNAPITNARIFVGQYERGVTPIADTDPATPGPNLDNVARFVPEHTSGTDTNTEAYEFVVQAPGYGHVRFRVEDVDAGDSRTINIYMPTNRASTAKGAVATGDGTSHSSLIDDTEGTNWQSNGAPVEGRQVLVDLAGGSHRVDRVKVSALLQPGQNRFTALREFEVHACNVSPSGDVIIDGVAYECRRIVRARNDDGFPTAPPRPVAPEMILRTWNASGGHSATHVLFRVLENMCTGEEAFQGEQDNDEPNTTDCRTGVAGVLPPRNTQVFASELEVFTSDPRVDGARDED